MSVTIKIMSVGASGVGKSTIGNCLVEGKPDGTSFTTSSTSDTCTKEAKWVTGSVCSYCDVPPIPDASADKTREYYDIVIKEARKEMNLILFVFKYEIEDFGPFSKARMLFRELKKSNAVNFLLINDMNENNNAGETEYYRFEKRIRECTGVSFSHMMTMNNKTMVNCLTALLELVHCSNLKVPHASPSLRTYFELKPYVEELDKNQNFEQIAMEEEKAKISRIEKELKEMGADDSIPIPVENNIISDTAIWMPYCNPNSSYVSHPFAMESASKELEVEVKKMELQLARTRIKFDVEETTKVLQDACQSFKELE